MVNTYRNEVLRTCRETDDLKTKLGMGALGLAGETGEVVDLIKKVLHHGTPLDRAQLINEMGDVRWYLEYLAAALDVSMSEIEANNVSKLRARYPNGFSYMDANKPRN